MPAPSPRHARLLRGHFCRTLPSRRRPLHINALQGVNHEVVARYARACGVEEFFHARIIVVWANSVSINKSMDNAINGITNGVAI